MQTLIIGANGQLGTELRQLLDSTQTKYLATDSKILDITNKAMVEAFFAEHKPSLVYDCAAYTAVDKAEAEGKATNWQINAVGTRYVAEAAESVGATVMYISTDYVFDGISKELYTVSDQPDPKNEYGKAKYAGEQAIQKYLSNYYIIRTSWLYGEFEHNFVYTMLNLAKTHSQISVVNDQFGRPCWAKDLARFMIYTTQQNLPFGIYHLANEGTCSWYEFAQEILKDKDVAVLSINSGQYPQEALRPKHAILDLSKTQQSGFQNSSWQLALHTFLQQININ